MPVGDAVQKIPTLEEQVAAFKGFTTENGEVSAGEQTAEEAEASAAREAANEAAKLAINGGEEAVTGEKSADEAAKSEKDDAAKTPKTKKTADERIAEVTRKYRAEQRERENERRTFEQRIAALERGETKPLTPEKQAATDGAPDPKKFQYGELDAEYIRALARYETRQELEVAAKKTKEDQQRDAAAQEAQKFAERLEAFSVKGAAKYDDFEEVVTESAKAGEWKLSHDLGKMLLDSEHGPAIAYYLATHPEEADVLFGKTPLEQAAWLGRQEAKQPQSSSAPAKPAAKTTKAPLPPKDVAKGAGGNSGAPAEDTNDFKAFERGWRQSIGA